MCSVQTAVLKAAQLNFVESTAQSIAVVLVASTLIKCLVFANWYFFFLQARSVSRHLAEQQKLLTPRSALLRSLSQTHAVESPLELVE